MNGIARLLIVAGLVVSGLGAAQAQNSERFKDNGDETVSDLDTGLMWEKKTGTVNNHPRGEAGICWSAKECPDVHNVNNEYQWSNDFDPRAPVDAPDGLVFTYFLATLNRGVSRDGKNSEGCFAKHCDWRLPTIDELRTIVNRNGGQSEPTIDTIFGPTRRTYYWSETTWEGQRQVAWIVSFFAEASDNWGWRKNSFACARAVRGGLAEITPAR